jgi:Tfp pilus assembly protein PilF
VDGALQAAIAQWTEAARQRPDSDTVHEELARNAEDAGEFTLAVQHYEEALRLKPQKRQFLLDLGRVLEQMAKPEEAAAAYVAARAAPDVRISEQARERLSVLSITEAVERRALRYALLPPMLANRPLQESTEPGHLEMAERSWSRGYLADARRYYTAALESDRGNGQALLRLALIENMTGNDRAAYRMLGEARKSSDAGVAREAGQAWRNLRPQQALLRQTFWVTPLYSTRWRSAFAYGQFKQEFRVGWAAVRPYLSLRFTLDSGARNVPAPLSERSAFAAAGLATRTWRGVTAWAEFGAAMGHLQGPDGRAGVYHAKTFGARGDGESRGLFLALSQEVNYASRFAHNVLASGQQRFGYAIRGWEMGWLTGLGADTRREYWGNFAETGPSLRARLPRIGAQLRVDAVTGRHWESRGNPRGPGYFDVRVGIWYAITQ